ncbi:hypothetical protein [Hymenobacter sp. B81]|uniref:hypothetical protein n=1 Tax=Hymenobacter sp. B81 TaxID=3344878 RepID=UPI0037DD964C
MKSRAKVIIWISVFAIGGLAVLFWIGFQTMEIEDRYGGLQEIYYQAENGDIIIDSNKRAGFIYKDSHRIFVEENECMKDLNNWVGVNGEKLKINVYRPEYLETFTENITSEKLIKFIESQKLDPIITK